MSTIASLNVLLTAQTGPLSKGLNQAANMVQGFASKLGSIGGGVGSIIGFATGPVGMAIAAIGGIAGALHRAEEAAQSVKKLDAVLAATGNTTGLARSELLGLAETMEKTTNFSHVAAEGAETLLASFHNIRGDAFKDAMGAAADLSAVMGGDLSENAMKIGRALENPIQGMARLNRMGVGFSHAQEEQIKNMVTMGNVTGAQGMILAGIQGKFGGAAKAMASPFTQLQNSVLSVAENFGAVLLPPIESAIRLIIPLIEFIGKGWGKIVPYSQAAFAWLETTVRSGIGKISSFVVPIWTGLTRFIGTAFSKILDWIAPVLVSLYDTFAAEVGALVEMGQALLSGLSEAFTTIADVVGEALNSVGINLTTVGNFFGKLRDAAQNALLIVEFGFTHWKDVGALALVSVELGLVRFWNQVVYAFGTVVPAYIDFFATHWKDVLSAVGYNLVEAGKNMWTNAKSIWDGIVGIFKGHGFNDFKFVSMQQGMIDALKEMPGIAKRQIGPVEKQLSDQFDGLSNNVGKSFAEFSADRQQQIGADTLKLRTTFANGLQLGTLTKPTNFGRAHDDMMDKNPLADKHEKEGAMTRGSVDAAKHSHDSLTQQQILEWNKKQAELLKKIADGVGGMASAANAPDDEPVMGM